MIRRGFFYLLRAKYELKKCIDSFITYGYLQRYFSRFVMIGNIKMDESYNFKYSIVEWVKVSNTSLLVFN